MDYSLLGGTMAMIGAVNWMAADRSFFGTLMIIRKGSFWVACRWLGVGLVVPVILGPIHQDGLTVFDGTPFALIGGAALLLGAARKVVPKKNEINEATSPAR